MPIRPIGPRVVSNAITPRPTANLVRPPLFVVLDLPVVAPDHTAQISHGRLTLKDRIAITPICPLSIHGRISPSHAGQRSKKDPQKDSRNQGWVGSNELTTRSPYLPRYWVGSGGCAGPSMSTLPWSSRNGG